MKNKKILLLTLTLTGAMLVGCGNKETGNTTQIDSGMQMETEEFDADENINESQDATLPTDSTATDDIAASDEDVPNEETTAETVGDEYVDRIISNLLNHENYVNDDYFYRENAMSNLINKFELFDLITDVCHCIQLDGTVVIEFTYMNGNKGSVAVERAYTEEEETLFDARNIITSFIDTEVYMVGQYTDNYDEDYWYYMNINLKDHVKKGRLASYDCDETGINFTMPDGNTYRYERRCYSHGYLDGVLGDELYFSDEYNRRMQEAAQ